MSSAPSRDTPPTEPDRNGSDGALLANRLLQEGKERPAEALYWASVRTRSPLALDLLCKLASLSDDYRELALGDDPVGSVPRDQLQAPYVGALAAALARRSEYERSLALFRLAEQIDPDSLIPEYQIRYAEASLAVKGTADDVLARCGDVPDRFRHAVQADQEHPSRGGDEGAWIARFRTFTGMPELLLSDNPAASNFDRLTTEPLDPVAGSKRISVIMTSFRPDATLFTAIRSVLAQTWGNWELLLVDDASGPEYTDVLKEASALDDRIRLFRLETNSGTYRARNRALLECKGAFVTGLDSDDWAHPRWLERQAEPLIRDPKLVMTFANCIRVREDLTSILTGRPVQGPRSTSVMFRAAPTMARLGFFDSVRKGADTEFHFRFKAAFGRDAVLKIKDEIFTLVRLGDDTLTSKEIDAGWQHPARFAYQSAHHNWRQRIQTRETEPFLPADAPHRPFFAPSLNRGIRLDGQSFDEIYVADCRLWEESQQKVIEHARQAAAAGRRVGIMHLESLLRLHIRNKYLRAEILDFLNDSEVEFVGSVDGVETAKLVVSDASLWEGRREEFGLRHFDELEVWRSTIGLTSETSSHGTSLGKPKAPATPRPNRRRPLWRYRWLAALALVSMYTAAAGVWFFAGPGHAVTAAFIATSMSLLVLITLATSSGYRRLNALLKRLLP